ncbi:formylglycine-generating enzyme family protein [Sorangium sp. So ce861]|uniref:formylglycine-generating enzyme family protein n=1 Tax=Sorangium sp. So ce861 TaxID=3133323 RepID=UPI003F632DD0
MRGESRGQGTWVGGIVAVVLAGGLVAACGADPGHDPPGKGGSGGADTGGGGAGGADSGRGGADTGGGGADTGGGGADTGGGGAGGDATGGGGTGTGGEGAGAPAGPPSCGSGELASEVLCGSESVSCCDTRLVPGGTVGQTTVSSFLLDTYEVTVGRFRAFVDAGGGTRATAPEDGAGEHPKIPGSGWSAEWNSWYGWLEEDTAALKAALDCGSEYARPTWTDEVGPNEDLPINCVTWQEAFAFCVWDGARLPTTAELNYAAAGGDEEREYPWGQGLDPSYASYACTGDGSPADKCALGDILPVGSKPAGAGRWGQQDLSGNMMEFTRDWSGQLPVPCVDCAILEQSVGGLYLLTHGGSYRQGEEHQHATMIGVYRSPGREDGLGFRCARNPPSAE